MNSFRTLVRKKLLTLATTTLALAAMSTMQEPLSVYAKGGSGGGGGSNKVAESRVTGYVTAIDYEHGTIQIGASYYGSGTLVVNDDTSISFDNVNCSFSDLELGDWVEARYVRVLDSTTGLYISVATKLAATTLPSS